MALLSFFSLVYFFFLLGLFVVVVVVLNAISGSARVYKYTYTLSFTMRRIEIDLLLKQKKKMKIKLIIMQFWATIRNIQFQLWHCKRDAAKNERKAACYWFSLFMVRLTFLHLEKVFCSDLNWVF